jgi:hypothetical protein
MFDAREATQGHCTATSTYQPHHRASQKNEIFPSATAQLKINWLVTTLSFECEYSKSLFEY